MSARLDEDDDKDEPKTDQNRELAEGLEGRLKELIGKLTKEMGPATEEVRKSLERAVGEIHRSLEKEGVSGEEIAKESTGRSRAWQGVRERWSGQQRTA